MVPTQVIVGDATLTRNAPGTLIGGTPVSLGFSALVIGTSTIPFATPDSAPFYTVIGQPVAVGPAGISIAGSTISNNGPAVTISGTTVSLGSFGLVINDASTFTIPAVQPLQSVFAVGDQSVTEQYGRIVFPISQAVANTSTPTALTMAGLSPTTSTQAIANASTAATGTTEGPVRTGSTQAVANPSISATKTTAGLLPTVSTQPSTGATLNLRGDYITAVIVLCALVLVVLWE